MLSNIRGKSFIFSSSKKAVPQISQFNIRALRSAPGPLNNLAACLQSEEVGLKLC